MLKTNRKILMPLFIIILLALQIITAYFLITPVMAVIGCIVILIAAIHWESVGGLLASTACSGLVLACRYLGILQESAWLPIVMTVFLYYTMGIGIGAVIGTVRKQRNRLMVSESRNQSLISDLANEKERLNITLASIGDGVIATNREGQINLINKVACQLTGWESEEAIGKPFCEVFTIAGSDRGEGCDNLIQNVLQKGQVNELARNTVLISKDGAERIVADSASPIKDMAGNILGIIMVFRDNTQQIQREERIRYLSYHDRMTGLYNRSFFDEELKRLDTARQLPLSFIIGDVNGLKLANDAFGHQAGDKLLITIARIIGESTRKEDIVCRWGGDEFCRYFAADGFSPRRKDYRAD